MAPTIKPIMQIRNELVTPKFALTKSIPAPLIKANTAGNEISSKNCKTDRWESFKL